MDLEKLEQNTQKLVDDLDEGSFIYNLLLAYDFPKATITRLKNGDRNQSKKPGEIIWKKNLCFTDQPNGDLFTCIDTLKSDPTVRKHHPRFIVVTDYETLLAIDTKTEDSLDIPITELPKRANFFLPWAGMEKSAITSESPADIKAAEKMGQLYDLLLQNNEIESDESRHALNVFLSRLLFCFFAEDTGIFEDDQFTKLIDSHTVEDGSNLQPLLERLYRALNTEDRSEYPDYLQAFPYVNGGLFADELPIPAFSRKSRKMLIDCGALNWKAINPDIFGSMIQAVTLGEERSSLGMHYTSVVNIMKVIEPLFLNDLKEGLEKADGNEKKLEKLLGRIYHIRLFDPACGSGNFLIIAYKELCRIEIETFQQLLELNPGKWGVARSGIRLNQFFGIEIDDFATETTRLSLWLAEHQMNIEFKEIFGHANASLPLDDCGNITCANSLRIDWDVICPPDGGDTFIMGNPPYCGARNQTRSQKDDVRQVLAGFSGVNGLDYIACFVKKAADYVSRPGAFAGLVTTNSICQGEQVGFLWPYVLGLDVEIGFAYKSFKWTNNARGNAGVTCVILGLRKASTAVKYLYDGRSLKAVSNISPYVAEGESIIVHKSTRVIADLPPMVYGNQPIDGGYLKLSREERNSLLETSPESGRFIMKLTGGKEFLGGEDRWCLWIEDKDFANARQIPQVCDRIDKVKEFRAVGGQVARSLVDKSHQFRYRHRAEKIFLLVPQTSSESRAYMPVGFFSSDYIVHHSAQVIYDPKPWVFAIISSRMHMVWVKAIGGRLKTDIRYSNQLCYNTFPFPDLSEGQEAQLEKLVFDILDERERYSDKTIAELYDDADMPPSLAEIHSRIDVYVERCYRKKPFSDDDERLRSLLSLYQERTHPVGH